MNAVEYAQLRIASVLAELEIATGQHVDNVAIRNTDASTVGNAVPQLIREVQIQLRPIPGSNWVTT